MTPQDALGAGQQLLEQIVDFGVGGEEIMDNRPPISDISRTPGKILTWISFGHQHTLGFGTGSLVHPIALFVLVPLAIC